MGAFIPDNMGNNQGSRADNPSHHSITSKRHSDPIKKSDDDFDEYEGDESDGEFRVPLRQLPGSLDIDDHQLATGDSVASASEDNQVSASCAPAAEVSSSSVSGMTIPDVAIVLVHSGET